ncbi:MAG: SpoVR family protein [Pseudomonadota bacterium]|nr:SpoVR family protein [Pseudomonadota bacterium]
MLGLDTRLTDELNYYVKEIEKVARQSGLEPCTTIFELVDYKQLNEIAAYMGFPTRYPHWRFGMEYEKLAKSYTYGLAIIYEMVINNDPCYAYLLRANDLVYQKTVIAHVFAHCDFFMKNFWFSKSNRKMLNNMANHGTVVRSLINELGHDQVEAFIDCCLSVENLIDIHAPFKEKKKFDREHEDIINTDRLKLQAKSYMDAYINPQDYLNAQRKILEAKQTQDSVLNAETDEQDVLNFLLLHAPLKNWEWQILNIIRSEAYYFAPQAQTKILNEGWATYWHSKIMTDLYPLSAAEIVDYCDHYAGIVASSPTQINPYKIGIELLRYCEQRWDKGKFGISYLECEDFSERQNWDKQALKGRDKLFEVRSIHNDVTFIDAFLDEDFCHQHKMFLYDYDPESKAYKINTRDFKAIKRSLLDQLTNIGNPVIVVKDGNYNNRQELLLQHKFTGQALHHGYTLETLQNLYRMWKRPVLIETADDDGRKRIRYDGSSHRVEKL